MILTNRDGHKEAGDRTFPALLLLSTKHSKQKTPAFRFLRHFDFLTFSWIKVLHKVFRALCAPKNCSHSIKNKVLCFVLLRPLFSFIIGILQFLKK